ncbi:uncharacterized protein LOC120420368 [Culex pipiens pallens]|uniref:uncharacterized protein LOC120420368 n=1 Tax=Culex pipiens pallens TaxID=42434 RepID=UPI00195377F4|nr:uncharacterized protein LOC120420368 [Culex pipiens pallens]
MTAPESAKWFIVINVLAITAAGSELDVLRNTDVDCGFGYELLMATIDRLQEDIKALQEKVTILQEKTATNEANLSCLPAQFCRHYETVQFNSTLPFRRPWHSNRTNSARQSWHQSSSRNITNLQTGALWEPEMNSTASNVQEYRPWVNHNPFSRTVRPYSTSNYTEYQSWARYEPLNSTTRQYPRRRLEP